jgi:hypothetical protein
VLLVATELVAASRSACATSRCWSPTRTWSTASRRHSGAACFGNEIDFNRDSMRSPDFPEHKASPNEFRVMVFRRQHRTYGGTKVDQKTSRPRACATSSSPLKRPVVVGTSPPAVGARPTWTPTLERYGFFDADVVVIVVSSHDVSDAMSFTPIVGLDPDYPDHKPRLALWQIGIALPPPLLAIRHQANSPPEPHPTTEPVAQVEASMAGLRHLIQTARESGARVIVTQHFERTELDGSR